MTSIVVGVYLHLLLSIDIEVDLTWLFSPVIWPLLYLGEVFGDLIFHLCFVLERLHIAMFVFPLDLYYYRVVSSNLEERDSLLVELFHLPISHQLS